MAHPAISAAIVVGLASKRYGEVVGAFLVTDSEKQYRRPSDDELRAWVRSKLGKHKAPAHVFWLGENGVPRDVPLTGSGKVKKFEMAKLGNALLAGPTAAASKL